jgi:hypothetical protein
MRAIRAMRLALSVATNAGIALVFGARIIDVQELRDRLHHDGRRAARRRAARDRQRHQPLFGRSVLRELAMWLLS